jgi:hypothetical protein
VVVSGEGKVVGMVTDRDACMAAYKQGRALHEIPVSPNDLALESARESGRKGRQISGQEVSATLAAICEPRGKRTLTVVA